MATYKEINIKAGERLAIARKTVTKLSQEELAERMKLSRSSINNYESGKTEMGLEFLYDLHMKYGIRPNYITLGVLPIKSLTENTP